MLQDFGQRSHEKKLTAIEWLVSYCFLSDLGLQRTSWHTKLNFIKSQFG